MSVIVHIGRRVPKSWFRRVANKIGGLISFQENLWLMIKHSMAMAKRKANAAGTIKFVMTQDKEDEDMNYYLEWIKIIIQGDEKQEEEEYNEAMQMYQSIGGLLKREFPKDERLTRHFKTKILSGVKIEEAYKEGYGATKDNNLANKLLEMGILTHIEWSKDFDTRESVF